MVTENYLYLISGKKTTRKVRDRKIRNEELGIRNTKV
jgi:hypothetical protein